MYHSTETAQVADLLLPAAGWGEKEGTFINSERRIGLIKKVRSRTGPGPLRLHIFKLVAHYYGVADLFAEWESPEAVFQILKRLSAGQPCDITGIADYQVLDRAQGIQWPYPSEGADPAPERRLFADGRFHHADGRARFLFEEPATPARAAGGPLPVPVPDRPRQCGPVAHADAHRQIGRPAQTEPTRTLRRDQSRRCGMPSVCAAGWVVVESRRGRIERGRS